MYMHFHQVSQIVRLENSLIENFFVEVYWNVSGLFKKVLTKFPTVWKVSIVRKLAKFLVFPNSICIVAIFPLLEHIFCGK